MELKTIKVERRIHTEAKAEAAWLEQEIGQFAEAALRAWVERMRKKRLRADRSTGTEK